MKDLTIDNMSFSCVNDFWGLIKSFHRLESLDLRPNDNLSLLNDGSSAIELPPTFPSHLRIFKSLHAFVLPWVLSVAPHAPSLVEVFQYGIKAPDLSNVEDLLHVLGPKLHKLSVGFDGVSAGAVFVYLFQHSMVQTMSRRDQ
jgi:hypothetical protein